MFGKKASMSDDHYVSVTFLTQFCDEKQIELNRDKRKIYVFDTNTETFLDGKKKLIKQANKPDLDGVGAFKTRLECYEPKWALIYQKVISGQSSDQDYEDMLTYIILISLNNPKKQQERIAKLLQGATNEQEKHINSKFLSEQQLHIETRDVLLEVFNYVECLKNILLSYKYWLVKNISTVPFVTSDNPIIVLNKCWFVPLSKNYALQIDTTNKVLSNNYQGVHEDNDVEEVRSINRKMINNAEGFVYSSSLRDVFD